MGVLQGDSFGPLLAIRLNDLWPIVYPIDTLIWQQTSIPRTKVSRAVCVYMQNMQMTISTRDRKIELVRDIHLKIDKQFFKRSMREDN